MRAAVTTTRGQGAMRMALIGMMLAALLACATQFRNHGYVPPEDDLALLEVGRDTRETVAATIGRPSTAGLLNDVGWYYVQSVVENIERYGLADGQIVAISRRVTTANVKSQGFLKQLFGNIGAINAGSLLGGGS